MTFAEFTQHLKRIEKAPLPGSDAHLRMAPVNRPVNTSKQHLAKAKKAGVLALVIPVQEKAHLVLTKRTAYPGTHSAQMSFPGGKMETSDQNLTHTALRETREEIGVPERQITLVRLLSGLYIPPSNFWVQPVLGYSRVAPPFYLDTVEVQRLHLVPLSLIIDPTAVQQVPVRKGYKAPAIVHEKEVIWGATAMIISEIAALFNKSVNTQALHRPK